MRIKLKLQSNGTGNLILHAPENMSGNILNIMPHKIRLIHAVSRELQINEIELGDYPVIIKDRLGNVVYTYNPI